MFQAVEHAFPFKALAGGEQILYLEAALHVASYCEPIAAHVLDLVIAKLLVLDTDISPEPLALASDTMHMSARDEDLFVWEGESDSSGDAQEVCQSCVFVLLFASCTHTDPAMHHL